MEEQLVLDQPSKFKIYIFSSEDTQERPKAGRNWRDSETQKVKVLGEFLSWFCVCLFFFIVFFHPRQNPVRIREQLILRQKSVVCWLQNQRTECGGPHHLQNEGGKPQKKKAKSQSLNSVCKLGPNLQLIPELHMLGAGSEQPS